MSNNFDSCLASDSGNETYGIRANRKCVGETDQEKHEHNLGRELLQRKGNGTVGDAPRGRWVYKAQ